MDSPKSDLAGKPFFSIGTIQYNSHTYSQGPPRESDNLYSTSVVFPSQAREIWHFLEKVLYLQVQIHATGSSSTKECIFKPISLRYLQKALSPPPACLSTQGNQTQVPVFSVWPAGLHRPLLCHHTPLREEYEQLASSKTDTDRSPGSHNVSLEDVSWLLWLEGDLHPTWWNQQ